MPAAHAPKGGVTIHGVHYIGGQFIPADVMDSLSAVDQEAVPDGRRVGTETPERSEISARWKKARETSGHDHPSAVAAHKDLMQHDEAVERAAHEQHMNEFADSYFEHDSADDRVESFINAISDDAAPFSAGLLDEDTRLAIAEDMRNWSKYPEDWDDIVYQKLRSVDQHSSTVDETTNDDFAEQLLSSAGNKPLPFSGESADQYIVLNLGSTASEDREKLPRMLRGIGATFESGDGSTFVLRATGEGLGDGSHNEDSHQLDTEEGLQALFPHLGEPSIPEHAVPASARNVGRVSGGLAKQVNTSDFEPNKVDVYRPLSKSWFVLRRGTYSQEVADGEPTYELVHRKDLPPRTNLPDAYWRGLEAHDPGTVDQDEIDAKASRDHDLRGFGTNGHRRRSARDAFRHLDRQYGQLKNQHNELDGTWRSIQAHEEAANQLYLDFTPDDDLPEAKELEDALEKAYFAEPPDEPPEFTAERVGSISAQARDYNERDQNKVLDGVEEAWSDAEESYADLRDQIDDAKQVYREHLGERKQQWASIAEAAQRYRDAGGDPDEADRIRTVAERMQKRIKHDPAVR
jgi:hypothetical protein